MPATFESFGVPVRLTLDGPELHERMHDFLPPGWRPCRASNSAAHFAIRREGPHTYEVLVGGQKRMGRASLDVAVDVLDAQLRFHIATHARGWTFVHSGVVLHADGALLIPGESFSGKTTLVSALVQAGATYYSDEYAVIDEDGSVHPYPRRLSLRRAGRTEERHVTELGGLVGEGTADVAMVVLTRYSPGQKWRPTRLSTGQGVTAVLASTIPTQERPQQSLRAVSRALAGALVLEGARGEADSVARALLEALEVHASRGGRRSGP